MTGTGKIHIYYGNGKGKTTTAVGQIVRAAGSGLRVLVFQFLKDNSSSERVILEQIPNITCLPGREKIKSVSYTHLDVYKRQALQRSRNRILPSAQSNGRNRNDYTDADQYGAYIL